MKDDKILNPRLEDIKCAAFKPIFWPFSVRLSSLHMA